MKKKSTTSKKGKTNEKIFVKNTEIEENYLDCTSELKEEEYI